MKLNSTHSIYKQVDVSCSAPQLVLILLDGASRYAREAADHLRAERWAEKGKAVEATFECLAELRRNLNLVEGGEVALTLDRMYDFLLTKLSVGNASRDAAQFDQVVESIQTLRKAWQELFDRLRAEGKLGVEEGALS